MKKINSFWIILLTFFSLLQAAEIQIGSKKINLPIPKGFADLSIVSKEKYDFLKTLYPSNMQVVASFIEQNDAARIMSDKETAIKNYFVIVSPKAMKDITVTPMDFVMFKKMMKSQVDDMAKQSEELLKSSNRQLGEKFANTGVEIEMSNFVPLGLDAETDSSFTFSFLMKGETTTDGEKQSQLVGCSSNLLLINGKILFVYVYKNYQMDNDLSFLKQQASAYIGKLIESNTISLPFDNSLLDSPHPIPLFVQNMLKEERKVYSTKGHAKSQGVHLELEIPISWETKEGKRPHVVQFFNGPVDGNGVAVSALILVQEIPRPLQIVLAQMKPEEFGDEEFLHAFIPEEHFQYIKGGYTKLEGENTIWLETKGVIERANMRLQQYVLNYYLFYNAKVISVQFYVSGEDNEAVQTGFTAFLPLFQRIINTVQLPDKWK